MKDEKKNIVEQRKSDSELENRSKDTETAHDEEILSEYELDAVAGGTIGHIDHGK